jgi:hypothetical protein
MPPQKKPIVTTKLIVGAFEVENLIDLDHDIFETCITRETPYKLRQIGFGKLWDTYDQIPT